MACNLVGLGAVYWLPPCCCGWLYLVEPAGNHAIFKAHIMACLLLSPTFFLTAYLHTVRFRTVYSLALGPILR